MAPGYRASGQSRRANRGQVDHDIFEGLPVRVWKREFTTIAPPPIPEITSQKNKWDVELPWGMPKDSHLLPQHSQDLLRLARSGRWQKRQTQEDEEADADPLLNEKPEKKDDDSKDRGYVAKTWKQIPKNAEGPEIEYLAKRRKGLRGTAVKVGITAVPTVTKATVRKTDAEGNSYVEEVLVSEGQTVEGEVISSTVIADPAAATDSQATPQRRRAPPPKRKPKGPGRGRKKKIPIPAAPVPGETAATNPEGVAPATGVAASAVGPDGVKIEGDTEIKPAENANGDTHMADADDDEGEDGEDGEEGEEGEEGDSGDEGEDGDDQDQDDDHDQEHDQDQDHEMPHDDEIETPVTTHPLPPKPPAVARAPSSSPEDLIPSSRHLHDHEGSPLKHSTSVSDLHGADETPHDDEAEADGDDDDVDTTHAPPESHHHEANPLAVPQNYYQSANMQMHGGVAQDMQEDYNDHDEEMLEFDQEDGHDGDNIMGNEGTYHDQQHFGFHGHQQQQHDQSTFGHQHEDYNISTATIDFAQSNMGDGHANLPAENISVPQNQEEVTTSHEEQEGEGSFEDLLGDGNDLMAGLDKHLLESSGARTEAPEAEHLEPVTEPAVTSEAIEPQGIEAEVAEEPKAQSPIVEAVPEPAAPAEAAPEPIVEPEPVSEPASEALEQPAQEPTTEVVAPAPAPAPEPEPVQESEAVPEPALEPTQAPIDIAEATPIDEVRPVDVPEAEEPKPEDPPAVEEKVVEDVTKPEASGAAEQQ